MRALSDEEYEATFAPPMADVTTTAEACVDIWPYLDRLFAESYADMETNEWDVAYVFETADRRWQHVLIETGMAHIYLAVIVDTRQAAIHGHHLLNLNRRYGLAH